jgi:hypothetical protein
VDLIQVAAGKQSSAAAANGSTTKKLDPVQEFDKGIKRDPAAFPTLKDERYWDSFWRTTKAVARTQRVDQVLDPRYIPIGALKTDLFDRQKAYMYSVAQATLTNPKGQELVRRYEDTYDAQKIYQELEEYHAKSTKATQTASELLSYITSHRLGEDTWSGESYVIHWKDVVRQYHALIPVNQNLAEEQQLVMLQNAVHAPHHGVTCSQGTG